MNRNQCARQWYTLTNALRTPPCPVIYFLFFRFFSYQVRRVDAASSINRLQHSKRAPQKHYAALHDVEPNGKAHFIKFVTMLLMQLLGPSCPLIEWSLPACCNSLPRPAQAMLRLLKYWNSLSSSHGCTPWGIGDSQVYWNVLVFASLQPQCARAGTMFWFE